MMPVWLPPALIAFLCWGVWAFLPKLGTRYLEPRSIIVYETVGGLLVAAVVLMHMDSAPGTDWRGVLLALITGILGVAGALAYLYALQRGPVALIATITALYPMLAILLAYLTLGESLSLKQGVGIALGLVAMVLISG